MIRDELSTLTADGESSTVEFKKTTASLSGGVRTVCAMLNGKGGFVLFGVSDQGELKGQDVSSKTILKLTSELQRIEPAVVIEPDIVPLRNGKKVIVLSFPRGGNGPYTYAGKPYSRSGPVTKVMRQPVYERLLVERMHPRRRWELMPAQNLGIQDLDHAEITRTVDAAIRRGRLGEPGTRDPRQLLQGMGLIRHDELLNAAVALFVRSDRVLPNYTQCLVRLARFRGTTKSEFEDNRQVYGNAFDLLSEAQRFLRQHLPVAGRIVPNLFERIDDPLYPPEALRETLANAICHRDYATGSGSFSVAIFDDRLEVESIGRLPFGLTPADLKRVHTSQPWNPLIADVFYRRGLIEKWGRGTLRMVELAEAAGLVPPEFEERAGAVIVRFHPSGYVAPARVAKDLSRLQRELLEILAAAGSIPISKVVALCRNAPARRTVQENLAFLRNLGLVTTTGSGRGATWQLTGSEGQKL